MYKCLHAWYDIVVLCQFEEPPDILSPATGDVPFYQLSLTQYSEHLLA